MRKARKHPNITPILQRLYGYVRGTHGARQIHPKAGALVQSLHGDRERLGGSTRETFVPRASTPLIDAVYKTIKAVEKAVSGNPSNKVVMCIQTDGQENSSTEHTWDQLNALIKEKFEAGWQFNFMGAGIDAYQQASRMGITADQTLAYAKDAESSRAAFRATAHNTALYSLGRAKSTAYSKRQKDAAADKYDPGSSQPKDRSRIVDDINL